MMWREANRGAGTVASALRQIKLMESEQVVKRGLQMSNDTWRIKEEARALAGVWGFGHEQHQAQGCRICSDACVCSRAHLSKAHEGKTMLVVNKGGGRAELYVENQPVGEVSLEELLQEGGEEEVSRWYCNTYQHYCLNQVDPKAGGQVHATQLGYAAGGEVILCNPAVYTREAGKRKAGQQFCSRCKEGPVGAPTAAWPMTNGRVPC